MTEAKGKVRQTMEDILRIVDGYHPWAVVTILVFVLLTIILVIFGRKPLDSKSPAFTLKWDEHDLRLDQLPEDVAPYYLLLDEVRSSLTTPPPFEIRILRAVTEPCPRDAGTLRVRVRTNPLEAGGIGFQPEMVVFVVRRYEGYTQIVDLNPQSGKPKSLGRAIQREWELPNYRQGERLEVVVFLFTSDSARMQVIRATTPSKLFEPDIVPKS